MAQQIIDLTNGMVDLTLPWTLTSTTGLDLSAVVPQLSLGGEAVPGPWRDCDVLTREHTAAAPPGVLNKIVGQITVGVSFYTRPIGPYWLWRTVSRSPLVLPVRTDLQVILV